MPNLITHQMNPDLGIVNYLKPTMSLSRLLNEHEAIAPNCVYIYCIQAVSTM